jgi:hypothetical protein
VFVGSDIMLDADKMSDALTPKCRRPDDLRRQILTLLNDADARRAAVEASRAWVARNVAPPAPGFWTALAEQAAAGRAA